jgi:uncharacterized protein YceK
MRTATIVLFLTVCLVVSGCALLTKVAPSQLDEQGVAIPGTHQLNEQAQAVTSGLGVYGQVGAGALLLLWNFVEIYKAKKTQKGLLSTITALKQASDDPTIKEAWEKIKAYLANAHQVAGVQQDIDNLIAKL